MTGEKMVVSEAIIKNKMDGLEGVPALAYAILWQTREPGFLKEILNKVKKYRGKKNDY